LPHGRKSPTLRVNSANLRQFPALRIGHGRINLCSNGGFVSSAKRG
jgi:hypothetical protein